ncbi:MAG: RluA family pseudouridine synthase [Betaproteobacteria bacterium]
MSVDEASAGQRLDNFLMRQLKGVPKTHVYRIIRSGEVRVNKGRASAQTRVQAGDVLRLPPVRVSQSMAAKEQAMERQAASAAPPRQFPILFEDDDFLAIDKPAGVAVHGGSGVSFGVIEQLRMARPGAHLLELVHRLDRDTSGVLLVAKKRSALKALQDQFRGRETGKTYLALVAGAWPANKKVLDKPLHKYLDAQGERRVKVVTRDDPDGMKSVTLVKVNQFLDASPPGGVGRVLAPLSGFSLLEVTIKTGRTHQIRVHLASEGFPIAGDDKYGDFELNKALQKQGLKRMFLHAWHLTLLHPRTQQEMALNAALPLELTPWLKSQPMPPAAPQPTMASNHD